MIGVVNEWMRVAIGVLGPRRRRWATSGPRLHVEVRMAEPAHVDALLRRLARLPEVEPAIRRVDLNPFLRRAIVELDPAGAPTERIVSLIEQAEAECGLGRRAVPARARAPGRPGAAGPPGRRARGRRRRVLAGGGRPVDRAARPAVRDRRARHHLGLRGHADPAAVGRGPARSPDHQPVSGPRHRVRAGADAEPHGSAGGRGAPLSPGRRAAGAAAGVARARAGALPAR